MLFYLNSWKWEKKRNIYIYTIHTPFIKSEILSKSWIAQKKKSRIPASQTKGIRVSSFSRGSALYRDTKMYNVKGPRISSYAPNFQQKITNMSSQLLCSSFLRYWIWAGLRCFTLLYVALRCFMLNVVLSSSHKRSLAVEPRGWAGQILRLRSPSLSFNTREFLHNYKVYFGSICCRKIKDCPFSYHSDAVTLQVRFLFSADSLKHWRVHGPTAYRCWEIGN